MPISSRTIPRSSGPLSPRPSEASSTGVRIPMNSLSSSRNSRQRRCRRSRDGRRSCHSRPGSRPTPLASRSDGCRRRIGKRRSWCSNNMVVSQARSKLSNSTPTSSCRRAMNSFRRKRDLTRPEGETSLTEADVLADFDELLSTLEQKPKASPTQRNMANGVEFRIMPSDDEGHWYWEVIKDGHEVVASGVADTEPAAREQADEAARK